MTDEYHQATQAILAEIRKISGPPPVLSTEDAAGFEKMLTELIDRARPSDLVEKLAVYHEAVAGWESLRYGRYKTLSIERQYQNHRKFEATQKELLRKQKQTAARDQAEARPPASEAQRALELD